MSSTAEFLYSLAGALLLTAPYVFGRLQRVDRMRHRRWRISFGAGASIAYVFVDLLPELSASQAAFSEAVAGRRLPFPEFRVYTAALLGFLAFYIMDHITAEPGESPAVYRFHIGGFAAYCFLFGYLVEHRLGAGVPALAVYCVAIAFHFLVVDRSLRKEHGRRYDASGRWILAAAVLTGWATGILSGFPERLLATLWGLVGGGVVLNSVKDELPGEADARFGAFTVGALVYALLILLAG